MSTTVLVVGYATCSSLMLVVNKLAVHFLPAPSFVLLAQVTASWVAVKFAGCVGWIDVDELETQKLLSFLPVAAAFLACIFANIKTLQYANVETFIVFRASTPLVIAVAERLMMGRELPNVRSLFALLALVAGATGYVYTDAAFVVRAYVWVGVWYVIFCFDQLYIKHAVESVTMRSNWGRVYYTNLWASAMTLAMTLATEPGVLKTMRWDVYPLAALAVSCALGVAMSYFAFACRKAVSATSFTVIGNVCKIVTVLINICIWDKHASPIGLGALLICLAAAATYQQAPLREVSEATEESQHSRLMGDDSGESEQGDVQQEAVGVTTPSK